MKFRYYKRVLAAALAGIVAVSGMGLPVETVRAGDIVAFEQAARGASMENGMSYSASELNTTFDGTKAFEASADDVTLFKGNIGKANSMDISITFKPTVVNQFMNLLEICNSGKNNSSASPAEEVGLIVGSNGVVYLMSGGYMGSTDWSVATGTAITAGNTYTLNLSVSGSGFSVQMNNGEKKTVSTDSTKGTKKFVQAFFGGTAAGYTDWRERIDSVVVGGLKQGSYQEHTNFKNFNGEISSITIAGKVSDEIPTGSGVATTMFSTELDNTWLFGGGVETQGRFEEIGGVRNYVGQFEEHVRWGLVSNSSDFKSLQRYTINVGKEGQDAAAFAANLDDFISKINPKAVSYLIGPEDYEGENGTEALKTALSTIIDKSLAMKDGAGCVVIQYPHAVKDTAVNAKIQEYVKAAQEVIQSKDSSAKERVAVVNHYTQTDNDNFKNNMLTEEGLLNDKGHYEIAKQFSQVVYGSTSNFPTISETWTAEEAPNTYLDIMPEVTASDNSLKVTVDGVEGTEWKYILDVDGTEITGKASGNPFTIGELPEGSNYELTVQSGDGAVQLSTAVGTVTEGDEAQAVELTEMQQAIRSKVENTEEPLTWLFMGDSITHAAAHTHGYDGVAQIFEKYVKEDLGRTDDIIVNTACSGAKAETTLPNIEQRMTKYKPDIVSIMLGTNDTINENAYNNNLKSIVAKIREVNPQALIIFRTPTPAKGTSYANKLPGENGSVASMKKVAEGCGNILVIDQYTEWNKELAAYPYLFTSAYYYGDNNIHPGAAGQLRMAQQFIEECGLNTNTRIANLSYGFSYTEAESGVKPTVRIAESNDGITISKSDLQSAYGTAETIGEMTVVLTDRDGRTYTKSSGLDGTEVTMKLPTSRNYTVKVIADIKGSTAKHVTFKGDDILLTTGTETDDLSAELEKQEEVYRGNASAYTEESFEVFRQAYEAAQKAVNEGESDAEQLNKLLEALTASVNALVPVQQKVVTGEQKVLIVDGKVTVAADAPYTASELTWNQNMTSAVFTLTAKENTVFGDDVLVTVANAAELNVTGVETDVEEDVLTVTLTVKKEIPSIKNDRNDQPAPQQPSQQEQPSIVAGQTYDVGNYRYKVISTTEMTAEVVGINKAGMKKITVYNTVSLGGKSYKVTSIGASAFKGNKKVTAAAIGGNVQTIGKNAFAGCTKLKKVTVKGNSLKQIGAKAFYNCKALKSLTIKSKVLKKVGKNAFKGVNKKAVIKVPKAKLKAYTKLLAKKGQSNTVKIKK